MNQESKLKKEKSLCCNADIKIGGKGPTHYHICKEYGHPTDIRDMRKMEKKYYCMECEREITKNDCCWNVCNYCRIQI